jgi:hypothetical protein
MVVYEKELQIPIPTVISRFNLLFLVSLPGCYGVPPTKASEEWMCSRCSANALEEVSILHSSVFPMRLEVVSSGPGSSMLDFMSTAACTGPSIQ